MRSLATRALMGLAAWCAGTAAGAAQQPPRQPDRADSAITIDATVALASLMALSDGHIRKMADFLEVLAASDGGQAATWSRLRAPLAEVARHNVAATLWFALPDGSYWTVAQGRLAETLTTRPYFTHLMRGEPVLGDLVVSRSTGKSVAIVAVPVRRADGVVVGALGSSIYLDSLSLRLASEMALPEDVLFYAIDATPLGALHRDVTMVFTEPLTLGEDLGRAIRQMLAHDQGTASYRFHGGRRTLRYRKSPVTGWWYALGVVRDETIDRGSP